MNIAVLILLNDRGLMFIILVCQNVVIYLVLYILRTLSIKIYTGWLHLTRPTTN